MFGFPNQVISDYENLSLDMCMHKLHVCLCNFGLPSEKREVVSPQNRRAHKRKISRHYAKFCGALSMQCLENCFTIYCVVLESFVEKKNYI